MEDKETDLVNIFIQSNMEEMSVRFLQSEAIKRGMSSSTFYRLLKQLKQKGILQKQRNEGRKGVFYRLNPKALPKDVSDIKELQNLALSKINEKMNKIENVFDEVVCYKQLTYWLGALTLYSAYEAVIEGRPEFMEVPAYYVKYISGAQAYIRRAINRRIIGKVAEERPLTSDERTILERELQNPKVSLEELRAKYKLKPEYITQATEYIKRVFTDLDKKVFETTSYNGDKIEVIKKLYEEVRKS